MTRYLSIDIPEKSASVVKTVKKILELVVQAFLHFLQYNE